MKKTTVVSLMIVLVSVLFISFASADIIATGDVDPANPASWTSYTSGYIGETTNGTLTVNAGSHLFSSGSGSHIGYSSGSTGTVTVDGAGSSWTNNHLLYVGDEGNGTLNITNGGKVIGWRTLVANHDGSSGTIHFENGTLTTRGLLCSFDDLTGTGTINTHGLVSDIDLVFDTAHGLNRTLNIAGNSGQNITLNLEVDGSGIVGAGYKDAGTMSISDGINVQSSDGYIGYKSGSTGTVTVDGVGSIWTSDGLRVGYNGSGYLKITNGGTVSSSSGLIGYKSGSTGMVAVDGADSSWTNTGLYVGDNGSGKLNITNGGTVSNSGSGYIGREVGSTGMVAVDGIGSRWTNNSVLYVGRYGSGILNITNGGLVSSSNSYIGAYKSDSTCMVTVDGAGSTLSSGNHLYVGYDGSGELKITNGGTVSSSGGFIGYIPSSTGTVAVDGSGSSWNNTGDLYVGYYGSSGTLNITNSGTVSSSGGYIGYACTVDGAGSRWTNTGDLYVGYNGSGYLKITNGGTVRSNHCSYIGLSSCGSTGIVTVDGAGSSWTNTYDLRVAYGGSGTLNITNSGTVISSGGYIGDRPSSTGTVAVDGVGSDWINNGRLRVGYDGSGELNITNGGTVRSTSGYIGYRSGSTGIVTVDGAGSSWTNTGLYVGHSYYARYDSSGKLNIINGGIVRSNRNSYIGAYESDSTCTVTVDGSGSSWNNTGDLYVGGYYGSGELNITNGGAVSSKSGGIGGLVVSASTIMVTIDGAGSSWTNAGDLYVGRYLYGSSYSSGELTITNGGIVSIAGELSTNASYDNSFVNISTGGMLALMGDVDDSLVEFLGIIEGNDAIRYWDDSIGVIGGWADITGATYGEDYALTYLTSGDLAGYTVLTVPEPATIGLFSFGIWGLIGKRK